MALSTLVSQNVQRFIAVQMDMHLDEDVCQHWMNQGSVCVPDVIDMMGYVTRQLKAQWLLQWPKSKEFKILVDIDLKKSEKIKKQNDELKKKMEVVTEENEKLKKEMERLTEENEKLKKTNGQPGSKKIKKPKTAWIVYQNTERGVLKNENPDMANRLVLKELGKRWKKLKADAKGGNQSAVDIMQRINAEVAADKTRYAESMTTRGPVGRVPKPRTKSMYQCWCAKYRPVFKEQGLSGPQLREAISTGWKRWKQDAKDGKCADEEASFRDVETTVSQPNKAALFKKIRVAELREQLKKRKIDTKGKKADLVQRLVEKNIFPPFPVDSDSDGSDALWSDDLGFEPDFTERELMDALREIIKGADWDKLTTKSVRRQLEMKLGLSPKSLKGIKKWIGEKSVSIADEGAEEKNDEAVAVSESSKRKVEAATKIQAIVRGRAGRNDGTGEEKNEDEEELGAYLELRKNLEKEAKEALRDARSQPFVKSRGLKIKSRQDVLDLEVDECREELARRNVSTEGTSGELKKRLAKVTGYYSADQRHWVDQIKFPDANFTDWSLTENTLTEEECHSIWDKLSPNVKYFRQGWIFRELNIVTKIPQVYLCLIYRRKIHKWMQNWYRQQKRDRVEPNTPRRMRWLNKDATL